MNFANDPTAWPWRYRNSATSLSVVLFARDDVDGFGGREARKSPYAGDNCNLTSKNHEDPFVVACEYRTIYRFALCKVAIVLPRQKTISVSSNDSLNISDRFSRASMNSLVNTYPPLILNRRPSMVGQCCRKGYLEIQDAMPPSTGLDSALPYSLSEYPLGTHKISWEIILAGALN